ncbi:sensor histidine kinase [Sphingomonas sp. CARO-RG-8B-R24-01]|uniref:sensor histidine kinase n=1 Tax=Sphingomonas sp. CARO-RG-8B-R24-01 TaxID=2914831 RepID=UPI001F563179
MNYIAEDREGSVWVVTARGIDQFFDLPITPFTVREGLSSDGVTWVTPAPDGGIFTNGGSSIDKISGNGTVSLFARVAGDGSRGTIFTDSTGRIWFTTSAKLLTFSGKQGRLPVARSDPAPHGVSEIAEDTLHRVWIAGQDEQSPPRSWLWRFDPDGEVRRIMSPAGKGRGMIVRTASDLTGGLWVAIPKYGFYRLRDGVFKRIASLDREARGPILQILPVAPGEAWLATAQGAAWLNDGRTRVLDVGNGLPCDDLYGVAADRPGDLWLTTQCGLVEVPAGELIRWQHQPGYRVRVRTYGPASGYFGNEASYLVRSNDGKLWFADGGAAYEVDPGGIPVNQIAPPVQIQRIGADQRMFAIAAQITLPKLTRNLEIDYAGLSYLQPDLLDYRYRLFGHELEWTDVGNRRQAFYNDLPPGTYRFQVTACNKDGVCNQRGASVTLVVPPAWWQTWWFRTLGVVIMLGLIAAAVRWRLNAYAKLMRLRFDDRLEERTRVARDLHDTLMQTVLASKLLAEGGQTFSTIPEGRAVLTRLSEWLGSAADEGRAAVRSLRSSTVEANHLADAFELAALEGRTDREPETHVDVTGAVRELHPIVRDEIHRIGVEAIRNARAHSGASHIHVAVDYAGSLTLRIRDDGHGMNDEVLRAGKADHFGLIGMRERAEHIEAKLTISSSAMGTEIILVVPGKAAFVGRSGPVRSFIRLWLRRSEGPAQASAEVGS